MAEQSGQDGVKLFGFEIKRAKKKDEMKAKKMIEKKKEQKKEQLSQIDFIKSQLGAALI